MIIIHFRNEGELHTYLPASIFCTSFTSDKRLVTFKLYFQLVVMRVLRKLNVLLVLVFSAAFRQKLNKKLL
jgi:hypothetical protein